MIKNLWRGIILVSIVIIEYFNDVRLDLVFIICFNGWNIDFLKIKYKKGIEREN